MVRKISSAFLVFSGFLLFVSISVSSQQIIENPEKPLTKNAGRVLELKEILRITDDSGEFFFKYPYQLQIAGDGSIFLADEWEFLRFSSEGKFIRNLYKKGQGPGEISQGLTYFILGNELILRDSGQRKVWSTDYEGNLLREFEIPLTGYTGFLGIRANDFVFTKTVNPPREERKGLMDIPYIVYLAATDGKKERQVFTFYVKTFMTPQAGRSWTPSIAVLSPDGRHIVGSFHSEYSIQIVDIEQGKLTRTFNRKYPRITHAEDDFEREFNKKNAAPAMEFNPDVINIKLVEDKIWIRTSTTDPKKGDLWDVFDYTGKFLDSAFLGPGRTLLRIESETIFVSEKNADETIAVVKYKIIG